MMMASGTLSTRSSREADGLPASGTAPHALLRAALLHGDAAFAAWREWMSLTTIDTLDEGSTWLLPLLYQNLSSQQLAPAAACVRYENVFRHNWYKNHLQLHQAMPEMREIAATGQTPMLGGGAALALAYYPALAARPFDTVEVSRSFSGTADAVACEWRDVRLFAPAPTVLLEAICAAGPSWDRRSTLLWIADLVILARRCPEPIGALSPSAARVVSALEPLGLRP